MIWDDRAEIEKRQHAEDRVRELIAENERLRAIIEENAQNSYAAIHAAEARLATAEGLLRTTLHSWSASLADDVEVFHARRCQPAAPSFAWAPGQSGYCDGCDVCQPAAPAQNPDAARRRDWFAHFEHLSECVGIDEEHMCECESDSESLIEQLDEALCALLHDGGSVGVHSPRSHLDLFHARRCQPAAPSLGHPGADEVFARLRAARQSAARTEAEQAVLDTMADVPEEWLQDAPAIAYDAPFAAELARRGLK